MQSLSASDRLAPAREAPCGIGDECRNHRAKAAADISFEVENEKAGKVAASLAHLTASPQCGSDRMACNPSAFLPFPAFSI